MTPPDPIPPRQRPSALAITGVGCGLGPIAVGLGALVLTAFLAHNAHQARDDDQTRGGELALQENSRPRPDLVKADSDPGESAAGEGRAGENKGGQAGAAGSGGTAPPDWIPAYPGAKLQSGGMRMEKEDTVTGAFAMQTPDSLEEVRRFFEMKLTAGGFEIETSVTKNGETISAVVTGRKDQGRQTVSALITPEKGETALVINYEGPKP